jgi:HAD superfamily hydrolase (TIGR01509 family)
VNGWLHFLKFSNIENVIFDLDGTLIDSSEGVVEATNYALACIGESPRTPHEIRRFIGHPLEEMFRAFSEKSYSLFWKRFQERAQTAIVNSAGPLDGADRVLRRLHHRGYKMAVGTTKMRIHIELILKKLGWQDLIEVSLGADDVTRVKPDPEVFVKALQLLGGSPSDTVVVGDTSNDIYAAKAASLVTIAVRSPFGQDNELEKSRPDIIVDHLEQILNVLT